MHPPGVLKGDFLSIMCSKSILLFSFICILLSAAICYNIFVLQHYNSTVGCMSDSPSYVSHLSVASTHMSAANEFEICA